jgi:hypothetical protein
LISSLESSFTTASSWVEAVDSVSTAIQTFFTSSVVTTADLGTVPPVSWVGTGTGNIT